MTKPNRRQLFDKTIEALKAAGVDPNAPISLTYRQLVNLVSNMLETWDTDPADKAMLEAERATYHRAQNRPLQGTHHIGCHCISCREEG